MRCHVCGEKATKKDRDPYLEEIYDKFTDEDNSEVWWCDTCYQDALDDI